MAGWPTRAPLVKLILPARAWAAVGVPALKLRLRVSASVTDATVAAQLSGAAPQRASPKSASQ